MRRKLLTANIQEYTRKHCQHKICVDDYVKKLVAVKKNSLVMEYQAPEYQLQFATGNTPPDIFHEMIECISVYSGSVSYFRMVDVLGVVLPRYLPEWAEQNLDELKMLLETKV